MQTVCFSSDNLTSGDFTFREFLEAKITGKPYVPEACGIDDIAGAYLLAMNLFHEPTTAAYAAARATGYSEDLVLAIGMVASRPDVQAASRTSHPVLLLVETGLTEK